MQHFDECAAILNARWGTVYATTKVIRQHIWLAGGILICSIYDWGTVLATFSGDKLQRVNVKPLDNMPFMQYWNGQTWTYGLAHIHLFPLGKTTCCMILSGQGKSHTSHLWAAMMQQHILATRIPWTPGVYMTCNSFPIS